MAALTFCYDTLRTGGHFVCKYYQGNEEKELELRLKKLFEKVHREKPESSRNVRVPIPSSPTCTSNSATALLVGSGFKKWTTYLTNLLCFVSGR